MVRMLPFPELRRVFGIAALCLVAFFFGCDGDGTGPSGDGPSGDVDPSLFGQVVDAQGEPVADVVLSPRFFFDPPLSRKSEGVSVGRSVTRAQQVRMHYFLDVDAHVEMTVEDRLGRWR